MLLKLIGKFNFILQKTKQATEAVKIRQNDMK